MTQAGAGAPRLRDERPRTVLRNGLVDHGDGRFARADIVLADGWIEAIADSVVVAENSEVIDCTEFVVTPGIVDAHYHSNDNFDRGRWENLPLEPWMLFSYPCLAAPPLTAREIYVRTLLGGLELVRSGTTCVVDFLYELAGFTDESLEAVVMAYRDLGLRAVVALGMSDLAFHETTVMDLALVQPALLARLDRDRPPAWDEWEPFVRRSVERFHRPDEGISIALAPSGPQRCSSEMLQGCDALAEELDLVIHMHVLETKLQALTGIRKYGTTLPEYLDTLDVLSPRTSFEHGIWLTDTDISLIAERGVTVVHNPVSNMKLGSGICPVPALVDAGVNVGLGGDSASCNDGCDMFESLKVAALIHKLWDVDYAHWLGATEAWRMATLGSAKSAGQETSLGLLEEGRRADLLLLRLDSHCFTPLNDPLRQLVLCSARSALAGSIIAGHVVMQDGEIMGVNEREILQESREIAASVSTRGTEAKALADQLVESVRVGWLEAFSNQVGVAARKLPTVGPHH